MSFFHGCGFTLFTILLYLKWVFYVDHHTGKVIFLHQTDPKKNRIAYLKTIPFCHRVYQTSLGSF